MNSFKSGNYLKHIYKGITPLIADKQLFETDDEELTNDEKQYLLKVIANGEEIDLVYKKLKSGFIEEINSSMSSNFEVLCFTFKCEKTIINVFFYGTFLSENQIEVMNCHYYNYLADYLNRNLNVWNVQLLNTYSGISNSEFNYLRDFLKKEVTEVSNLLDNVPYIEEIVTFKTILTLMLANASSWKTDIKNLIASSFKIQEEVRRYYPCGKPPPVLYPSVKTEYDKISLKPEEIEVVTVMSDTRNETLVYIGTPNETFGSLNDETFNKKFYGDRIENDTVSYTKGLKYLTLKPNANSKVACPLNVFNVKQGNLDFKTLTISLKEYEVVLPKEFEEFKLKDVEVETVDKPKKKKRIFF